MPDDVDEGSPIHNGQTGLVLVPDQDPAAPTLFRDYQGLLNPCEYGDEIGFWVDTRNGKEIGGDVLVNGDFADGLTGWPSGASASAEYLGDGVVEITGSGSTSSSAGNWAIYQDAIGSDPSRWGVFRIEARHISGGRLFFGGNYDRNDVEAVDNGGEWKEYQAFVRRWPPSDSEANRSVNIGGDSGAVWQVRNLSLRMFPGNGAFQKVGIRKPILGRLPFLGRRNILRDSRKPHLWSRSAEFTYAPATDPFGGQEAGEFDLTIDQFTSRSFSPSRELPIEDSRYCFSIWLKAGTIDAANLFIFDHTLASGQASTMEVVSGPGQHVSSHPSLKVVTGLSTSQWTLLKVVSDSNLTPGNDVSFRVYPGESASAGQPDGTLFAYGPQAKKGTHISAYQKTGNIHDVFDTSPGAKHYTFAFFDGIDDHLTSAPVLMLPHSEAQYTLGAEIRESSDSLAMLLNQNSTGGNHWFLNAHTTTTRASYNSGGQSSVYLISGTSSPRIETISVQMEHTAPSIRGRIDGGNWVQTTDGDGTGGFTNDQLFIGSQTSASARFFHGLLYGLVLSDGVDDDVIDANEWWVNQRTQSPPPDNFWYPEFWNPEFWSGGFWGESPAVGTFTGSFDFDGEFEGTRESLGEFLGSFELDGDAEGTRESLGLFAGETELDGEFEGTRESLGNFTGGSELDGLFQGQRASLGEFLGSFELDGEFEGTRESLGQFIGGFQLDGDAEGLRESLGQFIGGFQLDGDAEGNRLSLGDFNGGFDFAGEFEGQAPADPDAATGVFTGGFSFGGSAVATRPSVGAYVGTFQLGGDASGIRPSVAVYEGGFGFDGQFQGPFAPPVKKKYLVFRVS